MIRVPWPSERKIVACAADRPIVALINSLPKVPPRGTYTLECVDGEWLFRRPDLEIIYEDVMEEMFGPDPALHDERRTGFKLPP